MLGILTEKPSAAKNFAKALGGMSGTFAGEAYKITASRGHLYEYCDPEQQVPAGYTEQYHAWDIGNLPWDETIFSWKRKRKKGVAETVRTIKDVLRECDEIMIATDLDPTGEGNLLAWEIIDELKLHDKKISRAVFMDESVHWLQKAFRERIPLSGMERDMDFVKARFRSQWDFLSMQFTRIASACGDGSSVLRQGRLKSAMVKLTGDQIEAVRKYKKIPFYQNRFRDENGIVYTDKEEPVFEKAEQVPQKYQSSPVIIQNKQIKYTAPPAYFDLAKLSSILELKGVPVKDTISVYQKMYEAQVVSYPRTEDKCITPEQFKELLPLADRIAGLVGVDPALLTHRIPRKTHVREGGAHGANRPGQNVPSSLDDLDKYGYCAKDIYVLLAKSYLASLAEDYEYEQQDGYLAEYPSFCGTAKVPMSPGFRQILGGYDDGEEEDGLKKKGLGTVAQPFIFEGFPKKPASPTGKWLMKQLENHDVGTGATRGSIYAEIVNPDANFPLLLQEKGKLSMTKYGEMSWYLLKDTIIGDLKTTERLMGQMRGIFAGQENPDICLAQIQDMVRHDIEIMKKNHEILAGHMDLSVKEVERAEGIWDGQEVRIRRDWGGHRFTDEELEELFSGNEIIIKGLKSKNGSLYDVKGKLTEQMFKGRKFIGFERTGFVDNKEYGAPQGKVLGECPKCGKHIISGKFGAYCEGKCGFQIGKFRGVPLKDDQVKDLLAGESVIVTGLRSKAGKKYSLEIMPTGNLEERQYEGKTYYFMEFETEF